MKSSQAIVASRNDLQYRLYHDILTELPNRYALEQVARDQSQDSHMASMVQLDIRDFTDINDSYGHAFGNEVIQVVAKRLRDVGAAVLSRSGGDEFTLAFARPLSPGCEELRRIEDLFAEPVFVSGDKVDLSAAIGVVNREPGMTSEDLIICCDLATHEAKDAGVRYPVFYTADMQDAMERKIRITEYLRQAIAEESVEVVWQPQVDTHTLELYGYEALCRLPGNAYYPNEFIPVAEMSGLIVQLDRIVTKKVVEQLGAWLSEGRKVGVASINFSAAQLRDKGYCDFLAGLLSAHDVPASLVKIEITESMVLGNEQDAEALFSRLRGMGITMALDDFGTGYSSLYRMAKLPIDFVKLDKSLVDAFMVPGQEDFVANITKLVHGLGKKIVVEGVETAAQYAMCLKFGCDFIQGYYFSKPLTAADAVAFNATENQPEAQTIAADKTRNADWKKYDRDENGRWKKKSS